MKNYYLKIISLVTLSLIIVSCMLFSVSAENNDKNNYFFNRPLINYNSLSLNNEVTFNQVGSENNVKSFQKRWSNYSNIHQTGRYNYYDSYQLGAENEINASQEGRYNFSAITQKGYNNDVSIVKI